MSDTEYDTDDSLDTQELNELQQNTKVYGGIERSTPKKKEKPKKLEKEVKEKSKEMHVKEQVPEEVKDQEPEPVVKKPRGRPKKVRNEVEEIEVKEEVKPKRRVGRPHGSYTNESKTERIIYLAPDFKGGYERVKTRPLTKKQMAKLENEIAVDEEEIQQKTKYLRNVDGSKDKRQRKERTQAQIDATKRMIEVRKKKLEDKKAQKAKEKEESEQNLKEIVQEAVVQTVIEPVDQIKKRMEERRRARAERQRSLPIDIPQRKGLTFD
jgi:hypothetical protein